MLGSVPHSPGLVSLDMQIFIHSRRLRMFRFKSVSIVHFLRVCVVSAVASGECVGLSTISTPEAAIMTIDHRRK